MAAFSNNKVEVPPGEGLRWALLCAVYLGAVGVAVAFSPAAGLWHPQPVHARIAGILP